MRESVFRFKQFNVQNRLSAMKVGTDGVLIGAWCDINDVKGSILDIGAGTGLISLMVAQRCKAMITAVEIDAIAS
ncbi:MAG: methyltransferase, partial [Muribaculaceae bacterium]